MNENNINGSLEDFISNIDGETFTLSAQIVGNILSIKLPSNTAESLAGWFNLIGETLITYATQEQNIQDSISKNDYKNDLQKIIDSFNEELNIVKEELKDIKEKTT